MVLDKHVIDPTEKIPMELIIHIIVGDLQRLKEYPEKGFQIRQEIPGGVWNVYLELLEKGFTHHLARE